MEEGSIAKYVVMADGIVMPIFDVLGIAPKHITWEGMARCEANPKVVIPESEFYRKTRPDERKLFETYMPLIRTLQHAAEPLTVNDIIRTTKRSLREEKIYVEILYKTGWIEKVGKRYAMPDSFRDAVSVVPYIV
jgi:hypothetical protein